VHRHLPPSDNKGKDLAVIKQILHWYILSERKIRVPWSIWNARVNGRTIRWR